MADPIFDRLGTCRGCGTTRYTVRELNLASDQVFACYYCLDKQRHPTEIRNAHEH